MQKSNLFAVVNPTTGTLFTDNAAGTHSTVRVQSTVMEVNNGYMNPRTRSAFIRLENEHKEAFAKVAGIPSDFSVDADSEGNFKAKELPFKLEGQIQVRESHEPFYEGQDAKINPTTGEVIEKDGKEVYRDTQFITDTTAPSYAWVGSVEEGVAKQTPAETPAKDDVPS